MPNERVTEGIVRDHLVRFSVPDQVVSEQTSDDPRIKRALVRASKSGGPGAGQPEFLITLPDAPDLVIVVECKADTLGALDDGNSLIEAAAHATLDAVAPGVDAQ